MPSFSAGVCEVNGINCLYPKFLTFLIKRLIKILAVASDSSLDIAAVWCAGVHTAVGILLPSMGCSSSGYHGELTAWLH